MKPARPPSFAVATIAVATMPPPCVPRCRISARPSGPGISDSSSSSSMQQKPSPTTSKSTLPAIATAAIAARIAGPAPDMITVDAAIERILQSFKPLPNAERVALLDALGRVLVEDVPADIDLPPFDTTAMDGYAVRAADVGGASKDSPVTLAVIGQIAAGSLAERPLGPGQAYRILTGAPMPPGADSVVPYEETDGKGFGGWSGEQGAHEAAAERDVRVFAALEHGENVRFKGEVQRAGAIVVRAGSLIRPGEVAVLATFGKPEVWVYR